MKRCSIWWSAVFAMVLGVTGCGDDGEAGGTGATGGGPDGTGATGGGGDCARICESPCVGEFLPAGALDDCIRTCEMGGFPCTPETIAVLSCLETIDCGRGGSTACSAESEAFTSCVGSL